MEISDNKPDRHLENAVEILSVTDQAEKVIVAKLALHHLNHKTILLSGGIRDIDASKLKVSRAVITVLEEVLKDLGRSDLVNELNKLFVEDYTREIEKANKK